VRVERRKVFSQSSSGDLLHRREEILEDGSRAEVDLGVDLHAGDEAQLPALALEVAAAQVD